MAGTIFSDPGHANRITWKILKIKESSGNTLTTGIFRTLFSMFFLAGILHPVDGQILNDTLAISRLKEGVDHIYNCEFAEATEVADLLKKEWPGHPVVWLFAGMTDYWRYFPLTPASEGVKSFKENMLRCIAMCEKRRLQPGEEEYLLADIGARGLLLTYYADNGLQSEVIPMASQTYRDVVKAFDYTGSHADFRFVTGLYNYYREAYPEAHPFYKPFAVFFPRGDRLKGLADLEAAAREAIFLQAEATSFLCWIHIGYEKNYEAAAFYSRKLLEKYPRNNEYLALHVRSLLLLKRYSEAESILAQAHEPVSSWFQAEREFFRALLREKKYGRMAEAEKLYHLAIGKCAPFGAYAHEYLSYCYFGLSRIAAARGETRLSASLRKKAGDLATYKHLTFNE